MNLITIKLNHVTEKEQDLIEPFCVYIMDTIQSKIYTSKLEDKIAIRIPYMYKLPWIHWIKQYTTPDIIIDSFYNSMAYDIRRYNYININIDDRHVLKNTYTPLVSIIKFLNNGDTNIPGIGYLDNLKITLNTNTINQMWTMCCINSLGYKPQSTSYVV